MGTFAMSTDFKLDDSSSQKVLSLFLSLSLSFSFSLSFSLSLSFVLPFSSDLFPHISLLSFCSSMCARRRSASRRCVNRVTSSFPVDTCVVGSDQKRRRISAAFPASRKTARPLARFHPPPPPLLRLLPLPLLPKLRCRITAVITVTSAGWRTSSPHPLSHSNAVTFSILR